MRMCRVDCWARILQDSQGRNVGRKLDIDVETGLHRRQGLPFFPLPLGNSLLNHRRLLDTIGVGDGGGVVCRQPGAGKAVGGVAIVRRTDR